MCKVKLKWDRKKIFLLLLRNSDDFEPPLNWLSPYMRNKICRIIREKVGRARRKIRPAAILRPTAAAVIGGVYVCQPMVGKKTDSYVDRRDVYRDISGVTGSIQKIF